MIAEKGGTPGKPDTHAATPSPAGGLESFAQSTENLWENMTADNFEKVRKLISSYHVSLGGMLCLLSVKLDAWAESFPDRAIGSPTRRIEC